MNLLDRCTAPPQNVYVKFQPYLSDDVRQRLTELLSKEREFVRTRVRLGGTEKIYWKTTIEAAQDFLNTLQHDKGLFSIIVWSESTQDFVRFHNRGGRKRPPNTEASPASM